MHHTDPKKLISPQKTVILALLNIDDVTTIITTIIITIWARAQVIGPWEVMDYS